MITFSHLTKTFGRFTAVDDLSFEVAPREAVALWGPNGAGKTTAIKCLLGLLDYEGTITVDGHDAHREGKLVRGLIGYVPQELAFYDDLTTQETARFYGRLKHLPAPAERAAEVLDGMGLADHAAKPVGALSGGMKQRLALGLALLADPPVLVLDEPTSNLDARARGRFLELLAGVKTDGKTVAFTSHRPEEVEALADRVLVLEGGRLQLTCPAGEIIRRLGLRTQVRLRLPADRLATAVDVLEAAGYAALENGNGLLVEVPPGEKAEPIHVLSRADIPVHDFEVE